MKAIEVCGIVERGRQLGRTLGFPTVNLAVSESLTLPDGVYRSEVQIEGETVIYAAMSNLGCNPSVGASERRLESHLFGFRGDLYGCRIRVRLVERIREERRFDSLEELRMQLEADKRIILAKI